MAQDSLRRIALLAALAAFGVACELAAASSPWWAALDLAVGCTAAAGAAVLLGRATPATVLAVAFTVLWFSGTLVDTLALAYRGPLLNLLLLAATSRRFAAVAVAGWIASLLPFSIASPATSVVAALGGLLLLRQARLTRAGARGAVRAVGFAALVLAIVWGVAAVASGHGGLLLAVNDVVVAGALVVAVAAAGGVFAREAERALVVDLGQSARPGLPLTTRLSHALADPGLEIRYFVPDLGWVDERGQEALPPDESSRRTRVAAPGGGEVVLVHGPEATGDSRLARSAAAAAALSLETARLDAEVRLRARDVDVSRRRLLVAVDDERRALEQRLAERVLVRLRRVDRLLARRPLESQRQELWAAQAELVALGRGLYPPALARADLQEALRELASRADVPVSVDIDGDLGALPESHRAAVWFICSEALTNVSRHAGATTAAIHLHVVNGRLELEIVDDGVGGAMTERGLRGLADRVEALGGTFELSSPQGGPTSVRSSLSADGASRLRPHE